MASATADFERIYRRHARDVYRFALSVVRNPLEAEDVTQTTFLNAYRALERGDRPDRPRSWLLAIAHNAIRSRDRWRLRRPPEVPLDVAEYRLAARSDDTPAVRDLLDALGDLPDAQRQALARRELQGQTYPEIAEVLGISVSAVESLIARARRALRAQRERLAGIAVLRRLCEQGDGGVAAKAAVAVAAATALAGGMAVENHVAGPPRADAATAGTSRPAEPRTPSVATPVAPVVNRAPPSTGPHARPPAGTTPPPAAAPASATVPAGAASTSAPTQTTAPTTSSAAMQAVAAETTTTAGTVGTATGAVISATTTTVEPVTVPAVTAPAVTTPVVTTPVVTTPAVTTPAVTTPAVTTPAVTTPTVTLPPPTVPLP